MLTKLAQSVVCWLLIHMCMCVFDSRTMRQKRENDSLSSSNTSKGVTFDCMLSLSLSLFALRRLLVFSFRYSNDRQPRQSIVTTNERNKLFTRLTLSQIGCVTIYFRLSSNKVWTGESERKRDSRRKTKVYSVQLAVKAFILCSVQFKFALVTNCNLSSLLARISQSICCCFIRTTLPDYITCNFSHDNPLYTLISSTVKQIDTKVCIIHKTEPTTWSGSERKKHTQRHRNATIKTILANNTKFAAAFHTYTRRHRLFVTKILMDTRSERNNNCFLMISIFKHTNTDRETTSLQLQ